MKKILNFTQEQIDQAIIALKRRKYNAFLKEGFPDTAISIIIYTLKEYEEDNIDKIIVPILGNEVYTECWDYGVYYIAVGYLDIIPGDSFLNPIVVKTSLDFPNSNIENVLKVWKDLTNTKEDIGPCFFLDSIILKYQGKYYKIYPLDTYQSAARREYWPTIKELLVTLGCSNIIYQEGNID